MSNTCVLIVDEDSYCGAKRSPLIEIKGAGPLTAKKASSCGAMEKAMIGAIRSSTVVVAASLWALPNVALAQQPAEQRGEALVTRHCAMCHGIGRSTTSPNPGAPSFRTLGAIYDLARLEELLGKGALVGHPMMPNVAMTPGEARAVVRYLQSIQDR